METNCALTLEEAADLLRKNEVVAFPTETVYGLGAVATSDEAVAKIFEAKGRPGDNPLIVHVGDISQLENVVSEIPDMARKLMEAFWPGPLTIVLPKHASLSDKVTAGLNTVGVRIPSHPVALELLKKVNLPIAAPSANISGKPSPTTARHVADDLTGKIAGIVDGGEAQIGLESTVLDCTVEPPVILRPGGVSKEAIEAVIGREVIVHKSPENAESAPKSPGMKYKHYSPKAPMSIVKGDDIFFQYVINEAKTQGKKVGVLVTEENSSKYNADVVVTCGAGNDVESIAKRLYDALREFDEHDIDAIYSESFDETGLGAAIMNRLLKASGYRVIEP
ncbi:MAG: L-threonylcarbamoyladenylate synthase [Oscillospiraceae bacterium]|nr:L-threonylcarbamoyladenylate synthase [Oscillospiraceae bacterium]